MKTKLFIYAAGLFALLQTACKKDNYDPPQSVLTGKVIYQGQPISVRAGGVQLELWQPGYQLYTKIPVYLAQDGSFTSTLFDGDYKLVRLRGSGPWVDNTDTINVAVRGNTVVDVPVDPYFIIKTASFQKSGTNINATFSIQRVNTTRVLEAVRLYVGQTILTDQGINNANVQKVAADITDITQPITLSISIPASLTGKTYLYARVGVKTSGVAELAYSEAVKVSQ
ncbi:MAG: DUF3823 domain-containing protein [Chitinophagaceae bacterium]